MRREKTTRFYILIEIATDGVEFGQLQVEGIMIWRCY